MAHETGTICINVTLQVRGIYGFADFEQNQIRARVFLATTPGVVLSVKVKT